MVIYFYTTVETAKLLTLLNACFISTFVFKKYCLKSFLHKTTILKFGKKRVTLPSRVGIMFFCILFFFLYDRKTLYLFIFVPCFIQSVSRYINSLYNSLRFSTLLHGAFGHFNRCPLSCSSSKSQLGLFSMSSYFIRLACLRALSLSVFPFSVY